MTKPRGFMDDLSSEAQSARAKKNKGKSPWRGATVCGTKKAAISRMRYLAKAK